MQCERDTAIRGSSVVLASVMSDERLMTSLKEIDNLNIQLQSLKTQYDERVGELNSDIILFNPFTFNLF